MPPPPGFCQPVPVLPEPVAGGDLDPRLSTAGKVPARRRQAALAGHRGDPEGARTLLGDPDPGVRATALGALGRLGALAPGDLAAAAADPSPVVRRRAAEETPAAPAPVRPSLVALLADPDATVVEVTAWALGELIPPEPGSVGALVPLATGHDDPLVREAAVAALGAIGDPAGLPAILAAGTDKAAVRRRAVIALAPFDGPEVEQALERARNDRDWQVRQAGEDLS
jgi:HEAT repeat protein